MFKTAQPYDLIRGRLEEMFKLGALLQDYLKDLKASAPHEIRTKDVVEELHKLEIKLSIINDMLYVEKNSLTIERAIERLRNNGISQKI